MNIDLGSFCVHSQWTRETWKHFSPFRVLSLNTGHSSSLLASYSFLMALVLLLIPHEIIAIDLIAILVSPWLFNLTSVGLRRPWFNFWVGKSLWRRDRLPTPVFLGFPCGSAGKESAYNTGDLGSIPGLGRSPRKGKATHSSILAWRIPWTV